MTFTSLIGFPAAGDERSPAGRRPVDCIWFGPSSFNSSVIFIHYIRVQGTMLRIGKWEERRSKRKCRWKIFCLDITGIGTISTLLPLWRAGWIWRDRLHSEHLTHAVSVNVTFCASLCCKMSGMNDARGAGENRLRLMLMSTEGLCVYI